MFGKTVTFPDVESHARFREDMHTLDQPHRSETVTITWKQEPPPRHQPLKDPMVLVTFADGSRLYTPLSNLSPA